MANFSIEIVTPTRVISNENISYLRCPGIDGSFGVMAEHAEAIIALAVGEIKITEGGKDRFIATSGGFIDISPEKVLFLLETAEISSEIDRDRAENAKIRAKERLAAKEGIDQARAEAALLRAINRLRIANR
jgi:F-type H+-transporting ATPase subunit epsilon